MLRRLIICCLLAALPAAAWAGPYEFFGTGPRAIALGGAYAALSDDASGVYYNIAGLTQVERFQVELGYVYGVPDMRIDDVRQNVNVNHGVSLGVVVSTLVKGHRLSTGVNAFVPDDHMMRFLEFPTNQPHSPFVANANHTIVSLAGVGFEAFRWLSVGAGLNMLASNRGGVDFQVNQNEPSEGALHSKIGSAFSPVAGLWSRPLDWLRAGFSYREKLVCRLELPNNIHIPPLTVSPDANIPILRKSELRLWADTWSHFAPRQFELGLAFEPHARVTASGDLTYMQWSEFQSDAPNTAVYLTGGLADVFPSTNGPKPPPPDFRDTWNPAVGVEGRPLVDPRVSLACRLGYRYRPTPVPAQIGLNNYLDSNTHIFSSGLGVTIGTFSEMLPRPLSLDGFAQFHWMTPRDTHKADPNDYIGDYRFAGQWWNFGGNLTLRF
jgi:long-chain fatty acid transport protein